MATYGTLTEFRRETEEFSAYLERVELYFAANEIAEEKQVPIFLNVVGGATYGLLRSLVAPDSPKNKSLEELIALLKDHFEPKPNTIAERFRFHRRNQHQGESVVEYVAELRRLAVRCAFGGYLKEALRDRIVYGLRSEPTQRKLLGEEALSLGRAVDVAVNIESAQKHALALKGSPSLAIGKVDHHEHRTDPPANGKPCYRCGNLGHRAADCPFRAIWCGFAAAVGNGQYRAGLPEGGHMCLKLSVGALMRVIVR